jgi:hypothetical protein
LTSNRRREANVANARASTGPRSKAGKARSSKNALRHGLNVSIGDDPVLTSRAKELALRISGSKPDTERLARAWAIADAQFTLDRVRARRLRLMQEPPRPSQSDIKGPLEPIDASERLEPVGPSFEIKIGENVLPRVPADADQVLIRIMHDQGLEFARLDYYERRALSRRKHAIREFDDHHSPARVSGGVRK